MTTPPKLRRSGCCLGAKRASCRLCGRSARHDRAKPVTVVASSKRCRGVYGNGDAGKGDRGLARSVVVVDMTASGAPSRLMASDEKLPGIMDLLTGDAAFEKRSIEIDFPPRISYQRVLVPARRVSGILERLVMILAHCREATTLSCWSSARPILEKFPAYSNMSRRIVVVSVPMATLRSFAMPLPLFKKVVIARSSQ